MKRDGLWDHGVLYILWPIIYVPFYLVSRLILATTYLNQYVKYVSITCVD